jgi:hypothetical protein
MKQSLSVTHAEFRVFWDEKNNSNVGLDFERVTHGSQKKAHWHCPKGHPHFMRVRDKIKRSFHSCSQCSGSSVSDENSFLCKFPLASQAWDHGKNSMPPKTLLLAVTSRSTLNAYMVIRS